MIVGLIQKIQAGDLGHTFLKNTPESLRFVTWKLWTKKTFFTIEKSVKLCYTLWKFQYQKSRLMKMQHDFFLITPKNPTFTLRNSGQNKALIL